MQVEIRIAGIIKESIVDGPGVRLVVFTQGCRHNCPECHNPETHPLGGGSLMSIDAIVDLIKKNPLLDGITISGGEPFLQATPCALLAGEVKKVGLTAMVYSGYTFEELLDGLAEQEGWRELLSTSDILVDGRFEIDKRDISLRFRGSSNQRIIDIPRSLSTGKVVISELKE